MFRVLGEAAFGLNVFFAKDVMMFSNYKHLVGVRSSVGRRFILFILLFSSIVTFLGTSLQLYVEYSSDIKSIQKTFKQIESSYLQSLSSSLWAIDKQQADLLLNGILQLPDIQYLEIWQGKQRFSFAGRPESNKIIQHEFRLVHTYKGRDNDLGVLRVTASLKGVYTRLLNRLVIIFATQAVKTFLVSAFIFFLFYLLVGRHLRFMANYVKKLNFEKPYAPLKLQRKNKKNYDELEQLVESINTMNLNIIDHIKAIRLAEKETEKLEKQLQQAQKLESIGRLAGGVAHDFNNMLSIILGNAEMLIDEIGTNAPFFSNVKEIQKAAERSATLTRQLLAFARKQTISPKPINLNTAIEGMLKMLKRLIGEDIELSWSPKQGLWSVNADASQIDQMLANLCVNARDAIKDVGKVTIETDNVHFNEAYCIEHQGFKPGDYVLIGISDNGCGMDKATLNSLFEPFFTTKRIGEGTGLGLATVYGIIKQNNGFINVYSEPGEGTIFKLYMPRHKDAGIKEPSVVKEKIVKGNETILLVEDEPSILAVTKRMLERLGYSVLAANSPDEAIRISHQSNTPIDLLMTDVVMPSMNGRQLSKTILHSFPHMKCLFSSGYTANVIARRGVLDEGLYFISKPFSVEDLASKIREILDDI